jgi:hypothetical protein
MIGRRRYDKLRHGPVKGLAITQLVIGIICIIVDSALIANDVEEFKNRRNRGYYADEIFGISFGAPGLWCGTLVS